MNFKKDSRRFNDRLIIGPHNNQLPVGLTAQLVEHCIGIAEVRV